MSGSGLTEFDFHFISKSYGGIILRKVKMYDRPLLLHRLTFAILEKGSICFGRWFYSQITYFIEQCLVADF